MRSLTELIIELETVNQELEKIQTDEEYISEKVNKIYGGKRYTQDRTKEIENILKEFSIG